MSDSRLAPRSTVAELFRDHHGELVRLAVLMVGDVVVFLALWCNPAVALHLCADARPPERIPVRLDRPGETSSPAGQPAP